LDENFSVEQDVDFASIAEAVENANTRSKEPIRWNRYDFLEKLQTRGINDI